MMCVYPHGYLIEALWRQWWRHEN